MATGRTGRRSRKTTGTRRKAPSGTKTKRAAPARSRSRKRKLVAKKSSSGKAPKARRKRSTTKKPVDRKRAVARRNRSGKGTVAKAVGRKGPEKKRTSRKAPARASNVADLERLVRSLRSEKSRLHRRLSELVQEIGYLRPYELRTRMLERQLAERDGEIARLRARLGAPAGSDTAAG